MAGNITMLIWVGKNWLGQTDKTQSEIKATAGLSVEEIMQKAQKDHDKAHQKVLRIGLEMRCRNSAVNI